MLFVFVENKGAYCCLESWTLKIHVQCICKSHTTTMCADRTGSVNSKSDHMQKKTNVKSGRHHDRLHPETYILIQKRHPYTGN